MPIDFTLLKLISIIDFKKRAKESQKEINQFYYWLASLIRAYPSVNILNTSLYGLKIFQDSLPKPPKTIPKTSEEFVAALASGDLTREDILEMQKQRFSKENPIKEICPINLK